MATEIAEIVEALHQCIYRPSFVIVLRIYLYADIHDILRRVGYRVTAKFNVRVFHDHVSQSIA